MKDYSFVSCETQSFEKCMYVLIHIKPCHKTEDKIGKCWKWFSLKAKERLKISLPF